MQQEANWVDAIYDIVRQIPEGKVTTYGFIADLIGVRTTARMVGWAMNKSHYQHPPVPAHRVVNRNGLLSGRMHFETPETMQQLLEAEGVKIKNHQIVNFKDYLWQPK